MRLLLGCLLLAALTFANVHQFTIGHRPSVKQRHLAEGTYPAYLAAREKKLAKWRQLSAASQQIMDFDDMAYFNFIDLGTPRQKFMVFIDSGSSTLWVPDATCGGGGDQTCGRYCKQTSHDACLSFCQPECCTQSIENLASSNPCDSKRHFNSSLSSTYVSTGNTFDIVYQTGEVKGLLGTDTFCITNSSFCVPSQTFGQATTIGNDFGSQPLDGILGLGWPALAVSNVQPPFFNAFNKGLLAKPYFTVYLSKVGGQITQAGGQLTVGDIDTVNCDSKINWVSLSSRTYWQFKMDAVSAGTYSTAPSGGWQVYSDTASTFMGAPKAVIDSLAAVVGARYDQLFQSYFIDCDSEGPDVVLTVNGQQLHLTNKNYVLAVAPGLCQFAFFPMEGGGFYPSWMLGPPLIREYCAIHDMQLGQFGFAKAIQH